MNSVDQDHRSFKIASAFLCVLTALAAGFAIWVLISSSLFPDILSYLFAGIIAVAAILLICMQFFLTVTKQTRIWITLLNAIVMIVVICGSLWVQAKTTPASSDSSQQTSSPSTTQTSSQQTSSQAASSQTSTQQPAEGTAPAESTIPASDNPEAQPDPNAVNEQVEVQEQIVPEADPNPADPGYVDDGSGYGV